MTIILIILALLILGCIFDKPDGWTFTCPRCMQQVTFSSRKLAEQCKKEHRCV